MVRSDNIKGDVSLPLLTHWGRVTHICVSKLTIIGSDNGLSPDQRQAIIWNNAGLLLIGPLGTNFSEILIEILKFSFKKMRLNVSSAKRRPFCPGLNVLRLEKHALVNTLSVNALASTGSNCNIKTIFPGRRIAIVKIRWSWDCLIFIMGILIFVIWHP